MKVRRRLNWRHTVSTLAILLVAASLFYINDANKKWRKEALLRYDAAIYYSYLPAFFIYKDIDLKYMDTLPGYLKAHYKVTCEELPTGKRYIKTTMGLAYLHLPFFWLGHIKAGLSGKPQNGYSKPYENFLVYGTYFYVMLALILLSVLLRAYFSDWVTGLSILSIGVGTNLMYYSTLEGLHVHAFNFSLFCFFLYGVYRYFQHPGIWNAFLLGLLLGLIALIRPTNVLVGLLLPFFGVQKGADLKERVLFFWKNWPSVVLFGVAFILPWIPQMAFWHYVSGKWLFFSYGESERFFWSDPKLLYGFFSYRKGLFIYTPIMALAFAGLVLLKKYAADFFWPLVLFVPLNFYVIFSWWSWWYGGSYGMRPAIDSYGLMAIPLAAFLHGCFDKKFRSGY
ncbi:MAG: hypothetical protein IPJ40_13685 [Saprospirales bacterium]|nr:hypothetical protein [Saprospirales bacterium]